MYGLERHHFALVPPGNTNQTNDQTLNLPEDWFPLMSSSRDLRFKTKLRRAYTSYKNRKSTQRRIPTSAVKTKLRRAYAPYENRKSTESRIPVGMLLKQTYKEQTRLVRIPPFCLSHFPDGSSVLQRNTDSKRSDSMEIIIVYYSLAPQGRQN